MTAEPFPQRQRRSQVAELEGVDHFAGGRIGNAGERDADARQPFRRNPGGGEQLFQQADGAVDFGFGRGRRRHGQRAAEQRGAIGVQQHRSDVVAVVKMQSGQQKQPGMQIKRTGRTAGAGDRLVVFLQAAGGEQTVGIAAGADQRTVQLFGQFLPGQAGLPPEQPQDFSLAGRTQIRRRQDRFEIVENGRRFHHSYYYIKKNFKSQ